MPGFSASASKALGQDGAAPPTSSRSSADSRVAGREQTQLRLGDERESG